MSHFYCDKCHSRSLIYIFPPFKGPDTTGHLPFPVCPLLTQVDNEVNSHPLSYFWHNECSSSSSFLCIPILSGETDLGHIPHLHVPPLGKYIKLCLSSGTVTKPLNYIFQPTMGLWL